MICLIAPSCNNLISGGYLFNSRIASVLKDRADFRYVVEPPDRVAGAACRACRDADRAVIVVDSLFIGHFKAMARLRSALPSCRLVLLAHFLPSLDPLLDPARRAVWRRREARVLHGVGGCCVPSLFLRRVLEGRGVPAAAVAVCRPGVDRRLLECPPPAGRAVLPDHPLRILTVANWIPAKGLMWLLGVLEGLEACRWEWDLVGHEQADRKYGRRFRRALEKSPVSKRIRVHGVKCPAEVGEMLREADLFALPSLTESYGMVFAEAEAAGVPVIANRVGGVPEIVAHGETGYLCRPRDRREWSIALRGLLTSAETRRSMRAAALAGRSALRSWEETAAEFHECMCSLVPGGRP